MASEIEKLKQQVAHLQSQIQRFVVADETGYYFSKAVLESIASCVIIPESGMPSHAARELIENNHAVDFDQRLNTSSYVNIELEQDEEAIALMGLKVNLADQTVYPQSYKLHDSVVNMIARLWNCPESEDFDEYGVCAGAGTVGSTEACLLSGLAFKFRWRKWYAEKTGKSEDEVRAIRPNLVISSCFQAAWEKLFRYMDIEPRLIFPSQHSFTIDPEKIRDVVDEHTIGVVGIMGNHYGGQYDPIGEIDKVVGEINKERGFQIGIHVDAASGGFIAPFQDLPPWDFRLPNVLSISSSGHKYGESCCGTGWVIWRQRKDLSEHVAISVTYLGGNSESYTLNFSRPASGVYVQYYKFLRYGRSGYRQICEHMMANAKHIRDGLKAMTFKGKPRFVLLDHGDQGALPVVTARLNPECEFSYNDIDLQNVISQHHWYVSGYKMGMNHPITEKVIPIFNDQSADTTMFRVVVKNNLTRSMADNLLESIASAVDFLDSVDFSAMHGFDTMRFRQKDHRTITNHC